MMGNELILNAKEKINNEAIFLYQSWLRLTSKENTNSVKKKSLHTPTKEKNNRTTFPKVVEKIDASSNANGTCCTSTIVSASPTLYYYGASVLKYNIWLYSNT